MSFIEFIIIFFLLASSGFACWFWLRLKYDYFFKLIQKAIRNKNTCYNLDVFWGEPWLRKIVKSLSKNKSALEALCNGKFSQAEQFLRKKHKLLLALALKAHFNQKNALLDLENFSTKFPQNFEAKALLATLYLAQNQFDKAWECLENINLKKSSPFACGIYYYSQTNFCLKEGDLLAASQSCIKAEKFFIKAKAPFYLAKTYLLLGTIYRVSFVDDVAELMFRSASKIFDAINLPQGKALALANIGMQNAAKENFDVAEVFFNEANNIFENLNYSQASAEIFNQLGLTYILSKNFDKAEKILLDAQEIFKNADNIAGKAFNSELFSYLYAAQKDFKKSFEAAKSAEVYYAQIKNNAAFLNCLYLQAEALYAQNLFQNAEVVLRDILTFAKRNASCFHVANAYSLLGLIFMQKGELKRAKGLFQQSLEQEQKNNRLSGQVCDYANIGFLELRIGQKDQAKNHLMAAKNLALELEDNDMVCLLEKELETHFNQ